MTPAPTAGSPAQGVPPRVFRSEQYEGFHAGDAGATAEYVASIQSRPVANYRGSFSAVSGAADEAFPQTGVFASSSTSRAVAFFKSPTPSTTMQVFSSAAFLDSYAPVTVEPGTPNYTQPGSVVFNSADQAGPGVEYAPRADSVPVPFYAAPISQVISPMFAQVLDAWAATTFGRATPYYRGSRAITIAVYDPATNSFADWTPAALLSRAVTAYSAPKAQPQVAWGQSIVTDVPVAGAFSRLVAFYRAPVAFISRAYDQPAAVVGNDYASSALSRRVANYVGSYSAVWNAADAPAAADTWASIFASRAAQRYAAPRALVVPVYDPATNTFADWTPPALLSRSVNAYSAPRVQPAVAWGSSIVTDATALGAISRAVRAYLPPARQPVTAWGTSIVTDVPVAGAFSRPVAFYRAPAAFLARVYDQPPIVFGTTWTSVFQSRPVARYSAKSWMGNAWTLGSGVDPGPPPPQPDPYVQNLAGYGGGGFGAVMSDDFFKRYDARYKPRYVGRYKPTIRKQKP